MYDTVGDGLHIFALLFNILKRRVRIRVRTNGFPDAEKVRKFFSKELLLIRYGTGTSRRYIYISLRI
jgi:hypothetical protein